MTPQQVVAALLADLPRATLADAARTDPATIGGWATGAPMPASAENRLRALLVAVMMYRRRRPKGNLHRWLRSHSEHLDCDIIEAIRGDDDPAYLTGLIQLRGLEHDW